MSVWQKQSHLLIDTHCHLMDYREPQAILKKINDDQLNVVSMSLNPDQYKKARAFYNNHQKVHIALGLFPDKNLMNSSRQDSFFQHINETRFIGEIGLDFLTDDTALQQAQREFFKKALIKCHGKNKVISVHSRRAAAEALAMINQFYQGTAIMHWFSGPPALIKNTSKTIYFSINPAMLKSKKGKLIIQSIPKDQVLLESDGPNVLIGNQPSEPFDTRIVVESLTTQWQCTIEEVLLQINTNWQRALNS